MGRPVAGVVSEAGLLAAQDQDARKARTGQTRRLAWCRGQAGQHPRRVAHELMTAPAITIHPDVVERLGTPAPAGR